MDKPNANMLENGVLKPLGEITIYHAGEYKSLVAEAIEGNSTLEIDLSAVTELDSAGLQLLVMAKRACESRDIEFSMTHPSGPVVDVIELCNLSGVFGMTQVLPANSTLSEEEESA